MRILPQLVPYPILSGGAAVAGSDLNEVADYGSLPESSDDGTVYKAGDYGYRFSSVGGLFVPFHWWSETLDFVNQSSNPIDINPGSTLAGLTSAGWTSNGTVADSVNGITMSGANAHLRFGTSEITGLTKIGIVTQFAGTGATNNTSDRPWVRFFDGVKAIIGLYGWGSTSNSFRAGTDYNAEVSGGFGAINYTDYDTVFWELNLIATESTGHAMAWNVNSAERYTSYYSSFTADVANTFAAEVGYGSFTNTSTLTIKRLQIFDLS